VAERFGVERDFLARTAPEHRAAALEHEIERETERRELELAAILAGDQRDAAIEPVRNPQDQHAGRLLELERALVAETELARAGERHLAGKRQAAEARAVARVEV